jgi:hypothetical protein
MVCDRIEMFAGTILSHNFCRSKTVRCFKLNWANVSAFKSNPSGFFFRFVYFCLACLLVMSFPCFKLQISWNVHLLFSLMCPL